MSLEDTAEFFKALAHPSRILILNLCRIRARHTEELAELLQLSPGTTSHHLKLLEQSGLLRAERDGYYQNYRVNHARLEPSVQAILDTPISAPSHDDPWKQKVLRDFIERGRLKAIPAQRKKRTVILEFLSERFEPERRYPEASVNATLEEYHPDSATLRRELVGAGLLERQNAIYWRATPTQPELNR